MLILHIISKLFATYTTNGSYIINVWANPFVMDQPLKILWNIVSWGCAWYIYPGRKCGADISLVFPIFYLFISSIIHRNMSF